jgi:hypothetical protein
MQHGTTNDSNCSGYIRVHVEYHVILTPVSAVKSQILLFSFPCHTLLLPTHLAECSVRYNKLLLYSINWAFFTQNNKKLMYADDVHVPTR